MSDDHANAEISQLRERIVALEERAAAQEAFMAGLLQCLRVMPTPLQPAFLDLLEGYSAQAATPAPNKGTPEQIALLAQVRRRLSVQIDYLRRTFQ